MKKYLVALLSVMMILAFTVSSDARHEVPDQFEYQPQAVKSKKAMVELGGYIRIRGEISDNNTDLRDTDKGVTAGSCGTDCRDDQSTWNQKTKLSLKATVSPNTLGFVELETSTTGTNDSLEWGANDRNNSIYGKSNAKTSALWIRQSYIAHQTNALGVPSGFKAGHMLLSLGNGLFYNHAQYGDDAVVLWLSPADGLEVSLIGIKIDEGTSSTISDDADAYVVAAEGAFGPVNFSADITYLQDNSFATEATTVDSDALLEGDGNISMQLWNIGVRGDVDAGPVNIYADLEFQSGVSDEYKQTTADDDMDFTGYAVMVGAEANVGPVAIHGEFAYGSGDDVDTENEYEGFITSIGSGQRFTYLYDQHVKTASQTPSAASATVSSTYGNTTNTGLNNTWYGNVGVSAKAGPDIKLSGDLYILGASESVVTADSGTDGTDKVSDDQDIGVELDAKITYQVDTNLVYYIETGYLWAGDFYTNVTNDGGNIDNPWSVRNGLIFTF